ncbi:MAG TPA: beta-glucosidase BglX, partial [Candidatus Angelobacter sp.]|nr:beta-glucosidase BglX [Candidatus Angelobacter sp.]
IEGTVMRSFRIILGCVALASVMAAQAAPPSAWAHDSQVESRIDALVKQMKLDEKVGQLITYSAGAPTGPGTGRTDYKDMIAAGHLGSLFNLTTAGETNAMQKIAMEKSRLHIPLLFGLDVIHGFRTEFPVPLAMSATWDPALVEQAAHVAAKEASHSGVRWTYSPMVDIARDARWGRIVEGAGEDPYLGSAIAAAYVRGYQGSTLNDPDSIAACTKHFVGYGAAEGGRDYNTAEISPRTLRQVYLPPFQATVDAGVASFMSAFEALNTVPATANSSTLSQVLRREWNFEGFVVSDWNSIGELIPQGVAANHAVAAAKAFTAGVDMDMESNAYGPHLADLVKSGVVPESAVDESVRRVLRIKMALGLFERPYTEGKPLDGIAPDDAALARKAAEESFVLLKNDGDLLPLQAGGKTIALIGPMADDAQQMLGAWSAKGEAKDVVTLRSAFTSQVEAAHGHVIYAKGTDILTTSDKGFSDAVAAAKQSDIVVVALGEDGFWMTGEAGSRAHLDLPGNQQQLLEAVAATGKPVVLLLFSGRPLVLNWASQHVPAILEVWFPGVQAGPALANVLLGSSSPSGRLTVSFPRAVGQEPLYYNHFNTGRPVNNTDLTRPPKSPAEKFMSRYVDEQNTPLYPFGYGLNYSRVSYSPTTVSATSASAKDLNAGTTRLTVAAEVENTGSRAVDEVVQLYIRQVNTSVARPVRELKGFRRVSLAPGASQKIEFTLGRDELKFWGLEMKNTVEPAELTVWVAPDSTSGKSATVAIGQ